MKNLSPPTFIRYVSFSRLLAIFFIALLGSLIMLSVLFYRNNDSYRNTAYLVAHTHTVLDQAATVSSLSKDLQWESRNFVLTGNSYSLYAYDSIGNALKTAGINLTKLVSENTSQQKRCNTLQMLLNNLIAFTDESIQQKKIKNYSTEEFIVNVNRQIAFHNAIDNQIELIRREEKRLLDIREATNNKSITVIRNIFITSGILTILLLAGTGVLIFYYFQKRQRAEKNLAASENRLHLVLNSVKDLAIFMIDANGNILNWNEGASKIKGYKDEEVIGKSISIFYTEDAIANNEYMHNLETAARLGSFETEDWRVRKDGSTFWGDILITAIYNDEGIVQGFIKVTRDFTLHKKAEEEIKRTLQKEKELNEMKSNFVSMASHEFRTPLSTILSSASLLEHYKTTETQDKRDKHIQRIKSSVSEMVSILEEFLSLEKIEEGKVEAKREVFNLRELVNHVCSKFNTALKPGQEIKCIHEGLEEVVLDKGFTDHILTNLTSNAVKYSPADTSICISTIVDKERVQINIKDQGIGISPEDQQHLFERFFRASNTGNIKGTGLGLHIVKRYVDLMGGTICLKSETGKGSEFTVRIPQ